MKAKNKMLRTKWNETKKIWWFFDMQRKKKKIAQKCLSHTIKFFHSQSEK